VIAGSGRDAARLEKLAKPNVQFLGRVPDADLPDLMARCKAFIFLAAKTSALRPSKQRPVGGPSSPLARRRAGYRYRWRNRCIV